MTRCAGMATRSTRWTRVPPSVDSDHDVGGFHDGIRLLANA